MDFAQTVHSLLLDLVLNRIVQFAGHIGFHFREKSLFCGFINAKLLKEFFIHLR